MAKGEKSAFSYKIIYTPTILFVLTLIILFFSVEFVKEEKKKTTENARKELNSICTLKKQLIETWLEERKTDLKTFSSGSLKQLLIASQKSEGELKKILHSALEKRLEDIAREKKYRYAIILDSELRNKVAGKGEICSLITSRREKILKMDMPYLSSPHFEDNNYLLLGLIPMKGEDNRVVGYLMTSSDLQLSLSKIVKWFPLESDGQETILARKEGNEVTFLTPVNGNYPAINFLSFPIERKDLPVVQAVLGREGFFEGIDYRGKEVFSSLAKIEGTDWIIIVKRDKEKVLNKMIYSKSFAIIFGAVFLCLVSLLISNIILFVKQRFNSKLIQMAFKVKEAEKIGKVGFWELDHKTGNISWSTGVYEIFGKEEGRFHPTLESTLDLVHEQDLSNVKEKFFDSLSKREDHEVVHRLRNKKVYILEKCKHFYDSDGNPLKSVGTVQDVSKEHSILKELEESEEKFRLLSESSFVGVYLIQDGFLKYYNEAFCGTFGLSQNEIDEKMSLLDFVTEEDKKKVADEIEKMYEGEDKGRRFEFRGIRKDGETRQIVVYQKAVTYKGKDAILGTLIDVTERRQLEEKLVQSQKMESIGRFAGGIAHDFNNMLQVIISNSEELYSNANLSEKERKNIEEILSASTKSAALCKQILTFSRRTLIKPKAFELNSYLIKNMSLVQRVIGENIIVETDFCKEDLIVFIDPTQLDQILLNLASNSKDAIKTNGVIRIATSKTYSVDDETFLSQNGSENLSQQYAVISFEDNGCGMSKETLLRVFDPFFTTKKEGEGTGLGLATVYGIVKQNGGIIHPYSEVGKGSVFKIYLPISKETAVGVEERKESEILNRKVDQIRILVCEDEKQLLDIVKSFLEKRGFIVTSTNDPLVALEIIKKMEQVDLLLTDMVMPNLSGIELFKRGKEINPKLKCILMSGYSKEISKHSAEILENVAYIEKPFSISNLIKLIEQTINK